MKMMLKSLVVAAAVFAADAASAVELVLVGVSASGSANVAVNDLVTVELRMTNTSGTEVWGLGASARGYAPGLEFVSGRAVRQYLRADDGLGDPVSGPNLAGTSSGGTGLALQRVLAESQIGANGLRVQIGLSALTAAHSTIPLGFDFGLDANTATSPMFRLVFQAKTAGTHTILIDSGYQGDLVNLAGGATEEIVGTQFVVNVPEPSAVGASAATLASVLGVAAIRRRV